MLVRAKVAFGRVYHRHVPHTPINKPIAALGPICTLNVVVQNTVDFELTEDRLMNPFD